MASKAEKLAKKIFGSKFTKPGKNGKGKFNKKYKIVVFVPLEKTDELTFAMASAGAGEIGNYSVCSFRMKGVGSFMGNKNSNPKVGTKSKFEMTEEIRLEMICGKKNIDDVVDKIYEIHPYDEPAFEIYEVLTRVKTNKEIISFTLKKKISTKAILKKINPRIDGGIIAPKLKKLKISNCIVDCSGRENNFNDEDLPAGTLYITKLIKQFKVHIV